MAPIKCFLGFVILGKKRREKLKFLSLECLPLFLFFSKCSVFNNLSYLWELTSLLALKLLEYFVEIEKIVMDLCKARYYEKKKGKSVFFFTGKVTFFQNFMFYTFNHLLQNWSCTITAWTFFEPKELTFDVYSVLREKTDQNHREDSIF